MSRDPREALRAHALELFERNLGNDPQGLVLYKWQDECLLELYGSDDGVDYLLLEEAGPKLKHFAACENLPDLECLFEDLPKNQMMYRASDNKYVGSQDKARFPLYEFVHEFTHYWVVSGFSFGMHPTLPTVVMPLSSHGPVFLRSFIMFLSAHYAPKGAGTEAELLQSARDFGLAVPEMSSVELRSLWTKGIKIRKSWDAGDAIDEDALKAFVTRLADLDRLVVTGARSA